MSLPARYAQAPRETALGPAPDLVHWWRSFHDPALDALVQRALAQNLSLKAVDERLAAARALLTTPRDRHLPYASLYTNEEPTPGSTASYFQIGFDAIWQFGLSGAARASSVSLTAMQTWLWLIWMPCTRRWWPRSCAVISICVLPSSARSWPQPCSTSRSGARN